MANKKQRTKSTAPKAARSEHSAPRKGSKPRSGNGPLTVVKAFRVDQDTAEGLDELCDASNYTASEWLREAVLKNRTQVVARQRPSPDYKRLIFLANKTSNNINQLAHRANSDHVAGKLSERTYEAILLELHALTRFLKGALDADAHQRR